VKPLISVTVAALFIGLAAGCGDDLIEPGPGMLRVTTVTTGASFDPDGYRFRVDGGDSRAIDVNETVILPRISFGEHTVELKGLTMNCSLDGENPRAAYVTGGQISVVTFRVSCTAAGSLEVTSATTGMTVDINGYAFTVDQTLDRQIGSNATASIFGLSPGDHSVELSGVAANCAVGDENPRTLSITADATTSTVFDVSCAPALLDYIAFTSERDGNKEIYIITRTASEFTNLTKHPASDYQASFAPNGTKIAFTSDRDGDPEIYVMNYDGTGLTNLTTDAAADEAPAWSPDGSRIAFTSDRDGNQDIYVMNADGTGVTRLTQTPEADRSPAWSPEGGRLAFASRRDGNWEIYLAEADGQNARNLTNSSADEDSPTWSTDAPYIAFASNRDGNWEIYAIRPNGADLTNLTNDMGDDVTPSWAPGSAKIAFATDRDGDLEIYVLTAFGRDIRKMTDDGRPDIQPSWSPLW
jgi:Tol biopolymer transport system component